MFAVYEDATPSYYDEADLVTLPQNAKLHYNFGNFLRETEQKDNAIKHYKEALRKSGRTTQAVRMLERCVALQPRFVEAHVELLSLKPQPEKSRILARVVELEPNNWEHYILYGNWYRNKGLPGAAVKFFLEATRLSFKNRNVERTIRSDLISFRSTALMYRSGTKIKSSPAFNQMAHVASRVAKRGGYPHVFTRMAPQDVVKRKSLDLL